MALFDRSPDDAVRAAIDMLRTLRANQARFAEALAHFYAERCDAAIVARAEPLAGP